MKMIVAIIRPEALEAVETALKAVLDEGDHYRITVDTVDGHGRQEGEVELFRGQKVRQAKVQKSRVTVCVNEAYVEKTLEAVVASARSEGGGAVGDGKVFVLPVEQVVRIRTGERGPSAI